MKLKKFDELQAEHNKVKNDMEDEVFLAKQPYLAKLKILEEQMKPFKKAKDHSDVAKNVKKYRGR